MIIVINFKDSFMRFLLELLLDSSFRIQEKKVISGHEGLMNGFCFVKINKNKNI